MLIQALINLVNNPGQTVRSGGIHAMLSRAGLQRALQTERARADRSGHTVSWVLFQLDGTHFTKGLLLHLGNIIANRIRETDMVGWFDETSVCAILPETDHTGVQGFVTDILQLATEQRVNPRAVIYTYPVVSLSTDDSTTYRPSRLTPSLRVARKRPGPASQRIPTGVTRRRQYQCESFAMNEHLLLRMPIGKRLFDIVGASLGLLLASPILLAAAIAVKISSPGPIIFSQRRAGLGGRPFSMYKFRSMYIDAEERKANLRHLNEQDGPAFKIKNDPRITPIGRFLRSSSIDELPQLVNVLQGHMSLVGPRPPTLDEVAKYRTWHSRRLDVTPGITCIWQVSGRNHVNFETWMRMDIRYILNYSLWQDLTLLIATVPAVVLRSRGH